MIKFNFRKYICYFVLLKKIYFVNTTFVLLQLLQL